MMPGGSALCSLELEARTLVQRQQGIWSVGGGLCRCPAHPDRTPSLSVRVGKRSLLFHCFAGCTASAVLKAFRADGHPVDALAGTSGDSLRAEGGRAAAGSGQPAALRLWSNARPIAGTAAGRYLAARGVRTDSPELRYHARTPHGRRPLTCFRPALLAAVRDDSGLIAVQRTFLDGDSQSAGAAGPRAALGRLGQGAVRLGGPASLLGLAEGVETALAATSLFGLPCWATLGTERFGRIALPPEVSSLVLFLDNDDGGRRAETLARKRFGDLEIQVRYPAQPGDDWNDALRARLDRA